MRTNPEKQFPSNQLAGTLALVASLIAGVVEAADIVPDAWEKTLRQATFVKDGKERFRHPQYQYECLGLGGTVMRVGTDGFAAPGPGVINTKGFLKHLPYLSYQYWWDEEAHRHLPFELTGGYGKNLEPGQVTTFRHHLDIATGVLGIDLGLKDNVVGSSIFQSHREMFVTPEGVLVIRVTDSAETPLPFQMRVDTNKKVRVYFNQ